MTNPDHHSPADGPMLSVRGLSKSFGRVHALVDATVDLPAGQITAVIGDNGAGKSTLVRCITGVHEPDAGEVRLAGEPVSFKNPEQARAAGIETVFQDLALIEDLTVAQNLFLGRERTRGVGPVRLLDRRRMRREATEMVSRLAVNVPRVDQRVRRLSGGQRQAVALSRAASWSSKVVILDEPSAALGVQETERVEQLIRDLRGGGATILLISHNFEQVMRLADHVQVMRAGRSVARRAIAETDGQELVALVTGALGADTEHGAQEPETRENQEKGPQ